MEKYFAEYLDLGKDFRLTDSQWRSIQSQLDANAMPESFRNALKKLINKEDKNKRITGL